MKPTGSLVTAMVISALCAGTALGLWRWQDRATARASVKLPKESWEKVQESYPFPAAVQQEPAQASTRVIESVVQANPFSPVRRHVPAADESASSADGSSAAGPVAPQFLYKGRILVGTRQRAIVEDTANGKTHFLEVGQEVTGFKVLDITENQVVLSNASTGEQLIVSLTAAGRTN